MAILALIVISLPGPAAFLANDVVRGSSETPRSGGPATSTAGARMVSLFPLASEGPLTGVNRTLDLSNGTVTPGAAPGLVGAYPLALADDVAHHRVYSADLGVDSPPAISVINVTSDRLVSNLPFANGTPSAILVDDADDELFVADYVLDEIRVFNLSTLNYDTSFPVASEPQGLALTGPAGPGTPRWLYVTYDGADELTQIDTTNFSIRYTVPLPAPADGAGLDAGTGLLWVALPTLDEVDIFNASNASLRGTAAVGDRPIDPYVDDQDDRVLVPDSGGNNLTVINATSWKVAGSFPVGVAPGGIASDPESGRIFVASLRSPVLTVLSENGSSWRNLSFGVSSIATPAIVEDEGVRQVFLGTEFAFNLTVVNASSGMLWPPIPLGVRPGGLRFDASARTLVTLDLANRSAILLPTPSLVPYRAVPLPGTPDLLADGSDGTSLIAYADRSTVDDLNDATGALSTIASLPSPPTAMLYDPSTNDLVVTLPHNLSVGVYELSSGRSLLLPDPGVPESVAPAGATGTVAIGNAGNDSVEWLDLGSNAFAGSISIPNAPDSLEFDPVDDGLYAYDGSTGAIALVSNGTARSLPSAPLYPTALSVDPSSGDILATTAGPGSIAEVNWQNGSVDEELATGLGADGIAVDPADGLVFSANAGDGTLSVVSAPDLGPGPTNYTVRIAANPSRCAPVDWYFVGGEIDPFPDGAEWSVGAGTYLFGATPCPGFEFAGWSSSSEIGLDGADGTNVTVTVAGPGALEAIYRIAPRVEVRFVLEPELCGPVVFNGTRAANGTTLGVRAGTFELNLTGCPSYTFDGFSGSIGITPVATPNSSRWLVVVVANATIVLRWSPPQSPGPVSGSSPTSGAIPWDALAGIVGVFAAVGAVLALRSRRRHREEVPVGPTYPTRDDPSSPTRESSEPSAEELESPTRAGGDDGDDSQWDSPR